MFNYFKALISLPDISKWDTSKVTNMNRLFCSCFLLSSIPDITNWNIANGANLEKMFQSCDSLKSIPNLSDKIK